MIDLSNISTVSPKNVDKDSVKKELKKLQDYIAAMQEKMYAEKKNSLLVIFQGMDSSGKDGTTDSVFRECSPIGINVKGYGKPTEEEFAHDFLWRVHQHAPKKGMIQVFVRSHYEDILIQRVHKWISEEQVEKRINAINAFEELMAFDNNTTIVKCYLHLSPKRQQKKLQERIDIPEKNWKHNSNDWKEAKLWDEYRAAYHDVLNRCNAIPWHVIPADQRWYRNYYAAKLVAETLEKMNPQYPIISTKNLKID
jgi:PPK2 family polyphosphate:nucleotide phosphotransferase